MKRTTCRLGVGTISGMMVIYSRQEEARVRVTPLGSEGPIGPIGAEACGSELCLDKTPQSQGGPRRPGVRLDPSDGHEVSLADLSAEVEPEPPD